MLDLLCVGRAFERVPRQKSTQKTNAARVDLMRSFRGLFWELLLLGASEKPIRGHVETIGDAANVSKREALGFEFLGDCTARHA